MTQTATWGPSGLKVYSSGMTGHPIHTASTLLVELCLPVQCADGQRTSAGPLTIWQASPPLLGLSTIESLPE